MIGKQFDLSISLISHGVALIWIPDSAAQADSGCGAGTAARGTMQGGSRPALATAVALPVTLGLQWGRLE